MEEKGRASVRLALGRDIHIGHAQSLALVDKGKHAEAIGVGEAFQRDAEGLLGGGRLGRSILRVRREDEGENKGNEKGLFQLSQSRLSLESWRVRIWPRILTMGRGSKVASEPVCKRPRGCYPLVAAPIGGAI